MGALLERHGIGNGKYKVGGSYPNTISVLNNSMGLGNTTLEITHADTAANLRAIEVGEDNNFYVGSASGSYALTKYSQEGTVIWESNHNSQVTWLKYDPFNNVIWAHEPSLQITCYDVNGNVLFDVPFAFTNIVNMDVTENELVVAIFGNSSGATNVIHVFNKTGTALRQLSAIALRAMSVIDGDIYYLDNNSFRRVSIQFTPVFNVSFRTIANASARGNIVKDIDNNIYVFTSSAMTSATSDLYVYTMNGVEVRRSSRTTVNITPDVTTFINNEDIPFTSQTLLLSNGINEPFSVSLETNVIIHRQFNNILKNVSRTRYTVSNALNSIRYKWCATDSNYFTYLMTNKIIYVIDFKNYNRIIN